MDAPTALSTAQALFQGGRFAEAVRHCTTRLEQDPADADLLNLLAAAQARLGQPLAAMQALERALRLRPADPVLHTNLGNACRAAGDADRALAAYRAAVAIAPAYAAAHYNLGAALQERGKVDAAVDAYEQVLALEPRHAAALYNLGNALRLRGRPQAAAERYRQAVAVAPDLVPALNNLGTLLQEEGRREEAASCFRKALALRPDYPEAHNSLAGVELEAGHTAEAIRGYERALALRPTSAEAHYHLGNALRAAERPEAALASYDRALALKPRLAAAAGERLAAAMRLCDWREFDVRVDAVRALADDGEPVAPLLLMQVSDDPDLLRRAAGRHARDKQVDAPPLSRGERYGNTRLRVAYLSADFREHAVGHSVVEVFERHDRQRIDPILVSFLPFADDSIARRLRAAAAGEFDASGLTHPALAHWLRREQIDVAVDLMGYTSRSRPRVLAHRPAPAVVSWLGYPGTLGAPWVDALLADEFVVPTGAEYGYAERIVRLPGSFLPADTTVQPASGASRIAAGLPADGVVFACFNQLAKITPEVFALWMRLLAAVDHSVLWLAGGSPAAQANLRAAAAGKGVDPDRLRFAQRVPARAEHLGRLALADLFLDTFPYNAHSTAADALRAGLPVLTRSGRSFASRVAGSLLTAAGLTQLVTHTAEDYERRALALARDPGALGALRARLAAARVDATLFDSATACRALERALEGAYETAVTAGQPASL